MASIKPPTPQQLFNLNKWLAVFFAVQAIAILLFSNVHLVPITTSYLTRDPLASIAAGQGMAATATNHLFDVNLTIVVSVFMLIAAVGFALAATVYRKRYEADLKQKTNRLRWVEYAVSNSVMLVAVGTVVGVTNIGLLIAIAGCAVVTNLLGWALERYGKTDATAHLLYGIGAIAGFIPWIILGSFIWGTLALGSGIDIFVYIVFIVALILSTILALLVYFQYRRKSQLKDYLQVERMHIGLAAITKTAVAWLLFAGMLRP